MTKPPGFIVQEEASKVYRLKISLYGLKQSPRAWFGRLSQTLSQFGMTRNASDHSVFYRHLQKKTIFLVAYVDDLIITECGLLGCKPADSPMIPEIKLMPECGEPLHNPERYQRLIGNLNYLTVTRPNIAYPVSVVSQFMSAPRTTHWHAAVRILRYLKGSPGKGLVYSDQGHNRIAVFTDANILRSFMSRPNILR
ncbi:Retrovirus-related Pol polyprotein from transposon RE1-like protein [Drosera capensis]